MRIHHLNCATMCPPLAGTMNEVGHLVAHVLAIESPDGVILVDTGLGTADIEEPRRRLGLQFLLMVGPALRAKEPAVEQLARLGIAREDVRHIAVTHLDLDHAGGLSDFPDATVHVLERERSIATGPLLPLRHRGRYRPAQWAHRPRWRDYTATGERWFGLEAVRALDGVSSEVLLVPLPGHTLGHCGVAVRDGERWLLHAGDAYFHHAELRGERAPLLLEAFQRMVAMDGEARLSNRARLVELARQGTVEIFCAHDPSELVAAQARAPR